MLVFPLFCWWWSWTQWLIAHIMMRKNHRRWARAYHLLILTENNFFYWVIRPLNPRLVHDWVKFHKPSVELVFVQKLCKHISIHLLLIFLSLLISVKMMRVKNLINCISIYTPMLKGAVSNHPLIIFEILFYKMIFILVLYLKINIRRIDIIFILLFRLIFLEPWNNTLRLNRIFVFKFQFIFFLFFFLKLPCFIEVMSLGYIYVHRLLLILFNICIRLW